MPAGIKAKLHNEQITLGRLSEPVADFDGMSNDPRQNMFTGIADPFVAGDKAVRNRNESGLEGHSTWTTGRDLIKGTVSCCAFDAAYMKPADLIQTGRNLIYQAQMSKSPIVALSTGRTTKAWELVDRVTGSERRHKIAPIQFGKRIWSVVHKFLDDKNGLIEFWFSEEGWPDVSKVPLVRLVGDTYQETKCHDTYGQYSSHSKTGAYEFIMHDFAREATPKLAVELARA